MSTIPPVLAEEQSQQGLSQATTEQYVSQTASTHMESMVACQGSMEESFTNSFDSQLPPSAQPEPDATEEEEEPRAKRRAVTDSQTGQKQRDGAMMPSEAHSPHTPQSPVTPRSATSCDTHATVASSAERPHTRAWVKGLPKTADPPEAWCELRDPMGEHRGLRGGQSTSTNRVPSARMNRDQPYDTRARRAKEIQANRNATAAAAAASAIVDKDW